MKTARVYRLGLREQGANLAPIFAACSQTLEGFSGFRMALSAQVSGEFPQARHTPSKLGTARRRIPRWDEWGCRPIAVRAVFP